jgi:ATP-dependent Lon protease
LSTTITTRDKLAIEKTFSGLVKIIYPHGEYTQEEAKELMDFAIESRKRVKDQLRKMDETFNDEVVNFEYRTRDGKLHTLETLEVMEFGDAKLNILPLSKRLTVQEPEDIVRPVIQQLEGFNLLVRDNQSNISYKNLFGDYLQGATEYIVKDPYIRLSHQMRNFMELCRLIAEVKAEEAEVCIHLITNNDPEFFESAHQNFTELADSLTDIGIVFTYELNEAIHDRSIETNTGWKIILGRGLDMWQKTNGRYDIAEFYQEKRLCKEFEVTVVKNKTDETTPQLTINN